MFVKLDYKYKVIKFDIKLQCYTNDSNPLKLKSALFDFPIDYLLKKPCLGSHARVMLICLEKCRCIHPSASRT